MSRDRSHPIDTPADQPIWLLLPMAYGVLQLGAACGAAVGSAVGIGAGLPGRNDGWSVLLLPSLYCVNKLRFYQIPVGLRLLLGAVHLSTARSL